MSITDQRSDPSSATRKLAVALGVAATVVVLDQLTKTWALRALADGDVIDLIGSLRFNLAFNTGASFSMGAGLGPVFSVIVVVVVVLLLRHVRLVDSPFGWVATGMVVGGAIGNLLDRVFRAGIDDDRGVLGGAVVDFIDVQWWPIFNIADIGVVVGAILLVVVSWVQPEPVEQDEHPDDVDGHEV